MGIWQKISFKFTIHFVASVAKCEDSEENRSDCPTWADLGYCETDEYGDFMRANCKKSCDVCISGNVFKQF